jgi:lipopolysaccharide transport system ATP-binding protein
LGKRTIIKVENLSKTYLLNKTNASPEDTLVNNLISKFKSIGRQNNVEEFRALDNVSFEIEQGDRVGIIGRNGAGKSTLLKILSRITPPTKGRIEINGRLASLLEVGTGFHGDLTGRENIYLNGSILGMSKAEIAKKFDEIVDFSEIETFLDTPVKRYSSGMYVRLAFAVAAHLDPDILIVDEVLAVGDSNFQKKCLGKMNKVSESEGRTILFVSHQMDAIQSLCNKGILLHKGKLLNEGKIDTIISEYLNNSALSNGFFEIQNNQIDNLNNYGEIISAAILNAQDNITGEIPTGSNWKVKVKFKINHYNEQFVIGFGIQSAFGLPINTSWSPMQALSNGTYEAVFTNESIYYNSGQYKIAIGLSNHRQSYFYNDTEAYIMISDAGINFETDRIINKASGLILNQIQVVIKQISD